MPVYEQLALFSIPNEKKRDTKNQICNAQSKISGKILDGFSVSSIPFIGCDFELVYPILAEIMPKERILFSDFPLQTAIVCEMVCSAICHQMNWDFLRNVVYSKTSEDMKWVLPEYLSQITDAEVFEMLSDYDKPERIRKDERSLILRNLGNWLKKYHSVNQIFWDENGMLLECEEVRTNLLLCDAFSNDPEEKKLQLLLQKLSSYKELSGLAQYYQPAIDYHLVRSYLRRGLLIPNSKYAKEYINNTTAERKESTMAAIRQLCSQLLLEICEYTNINTSIVNQIEWHIGRSVCIRDEPDCFLKTDEAQWVREKFDRCPFWNTCMAKDNTDLFNLNEPTYRGISF